MFIGGFCHLACLRCETLDDRFDICRGLIFSFDQGIARLGRSGVRGIVVCKFNAAFSPCCGFTMAQYLSDRKRTPFLSLL